MNISLRAFRMLQVMILFLGVVWIWFSRVPEDTKNGNFLSVPFKGFEAPDFKAETLQAEELKLSDFRGSSVILNFWASWCLPCRAEMPAFQRIHNDYKESKLVVLAVNSTNSDNLQNVNQFVEEFNLDFPVLLDMDGSISSLYQVRAMPTTFFIDANGVIQDVEVGGPLSEALISVKIAELVNSSGVP